MVLPEFFTVKVSWSNLRRLQTCNKHFQKRPRPDGSTTIIDRPLQLPVLVILSQGDPLTHLVSAVNLEADRLASSIFQMPHFLRSFPQNKPITNQWIKTQTTFACNMAVPWSQGIKGSQTGWFSMVFPCCSSKISMSIEPDSWICHKIFSYIQFSVPTMVHLQALWLDLATMAPWAVRPADLISSCTPNKPQAKRKFQNNEISCINIKQ